MHVAQTGSDSDELARLIADTSLSMRYERTSQACSASSSIIQQQFTRQRTLSARRRRRKCKKSARLCVVSDELSNAASAHLLDSTQERSDRASTILASQKTPKNPTREVIILSDSEDDAPTNNIKQDQTASSASLQLLKHSSDSSQDPVISSLSLSCPVSVFPMLYKLSSTQQQYLDQFMKYALSSRSRYRSTTNLFTPIVLIASCFPITLTELRILASNAWLNDEIINAYLWQCRDSLRPVTRQSAVHVFSTFFFTRLYDVRTTRYCYDHVSRWTKNIQLCEMQSVIVPLNFDNTHWALAVIDIRHSVIRYYDSMSSSNRKRSTHVLLRYLKDEYQNKKKVFDRQLWKTKVVRNCAQQTDSTSCGLFLLAFAKAEIEAISLSLISSTSTLTTTSYPSPAPSNKQSSKFGDDRQLVIESDNTLQTHVSYSEQKTLLLHATCSSDNDRLTAIRDSISLFGQHMVHSFRQRIAFELLSSVM